MALYEDRILNHPLRQTVESALTTVSSLSEALRAQNPVAVERCLSTLRFLNARLADRSLAGLISDNFLNNANSWVTGMQQEAQNAINSGNAQHLNNMVGHAENIAQNLGQFPAAIDESTLKTLLDDANRRVSEISDEQLRASERIRAAREEQQRELRQSRDEAAALIKDLENQRTVGAGLIEALGKDATATEFLITAKEEGDAANLWRLLTLAGAAITGGVTIWLASKSVGQPVGRIVAHASVSLTLVLVVIYLGRQAAEHRAQQRRARTLGLQLASVGPFLVGLNPDQRAEVRKMLADRFFTADQHHGGHTSASLKEQGYPTTQELVQMIVKAAFK